MLPRIDAIGGSATGTISGDNEATWCDIFPNVPPSVYKEKVVDIFKRLADEMAGPDAPLKATVLCMLVCVRVPWVDQCLS